MLTFSQAVKIVFSRYATFAGRSSRAEYWYFVLFNIVVYGCLAIIAWYFPAADGGMPMWINVLGGIFGLVVLLPSLAVSVRRMHDIGKGGGWIFISLIPVIGSIWFLILTLLAGDAYPNRFGPVPEY